MRGRSSRIVEALRICCTLSRRVSPSKPNRPDNRATHVEMRARGRANRVAIIGDRSIRGSLRSQTGQRIR